MNAKDIVVVGFVAGISIETVKYIVRHEHYKNILNFFKDYPGFALSAITGIAGLAIVYKGMFTSLFRIS